MVAGMIHGGHCDVVESEDECAGVYEDSGNGGVGGQETIDP